MTNSITVLSNSIILQENRQDPITGDLIQQGDKVVICAACKSAFLEGSWKYMGEKHCNQTETLNQIPEKQSFKFVKKLEQIIFSAESHQGNMALLVGVMTGILSFILAISLVLGVVQMPLLWLVVALLVSIPFIFNAFETKGIEVKETAIYLKKGFGRKVKIPITEIQKVDFLYYFNFTHKYIYKEKYSSRESIITTSIPYSLKITLSENKYKNIELSEYDFNKNRIKFLEFFNKISYVLPLCLVTNNQDLINQFESTVTKFDIEKDVKGLHYFYGQDYNAIE